MRWLLLIIGIGLVVVGVLSAGGDGSEETAKPETASASAARTRTERGGAAARAGSELPGSAALAERKERSREETPADENRIIRRQEVGGVMPGRRRSNADPPPAKEARPEFADSEVEAAAAPSEEDGEPMYPTPDDEPPPRTPSPRMVELLREAQAADKAGDRDKALARLREAEDAAPEARLEEQMRLMRLNLLFDAGQWAEAEALANEIRKDPIRGATLSLVRDLLAKMGRDRTGGGYQDSQYDEKGKE